MALAPAGRARIEWADAQMPVLRQLRERFARERPLDGLRVVACMHVTAETANLARALIAGGAQVGLCAANPLSTQDDVAAALATEDGATVRAARGESVAAHAAHVKKLIAASPQIAIDDGAEVLGALHARGANAASKLRGGMEETTAGLLRLRALEADGSLRCPILAVNEAQTERAFNDRYGTGQSTLDGIMRTTNLLLAGHTVVVLGFGWTGKGVAMRARGAGASVIVCEVDPLRALEARMEGFDVMPALRAAECGDVFITVTGNRAVLAREHFERMKDGAVLANAGHFDVEIDIAALRELATEEPREVRPLVEEFRLGAPGPDGRRVHLLAHGHVVNLAAAEGHPAAVMDISFAGQALCAAYLARCGDELADAVLAVPEAIDREVALLKLESLGVEIDALTPAQESYRSSWAPEPQ